MEGPTPRGAPVSHQQGGPWGTGSGGGHIQSKQPPLLSRGGGQGGDHHAQGRGVGAYNLQDCEVWGGLCT